MQSHMSRARRLLAPEGAIVGLDGGYRLDLPEGALDADVFAQLTRRAREDPDPARAAALHRQALDLWRGPAFVELDDEWLRAEAVRLDELRTATTEDWIECRLAVGDDPALIGDLEGLTTANRFRERFARQLVLALHRDGRQADALRAATRFRTETEVWWLEARNGDIPSALTGSGRVIDTWARGGDWANLSLSLRRVFGLLVQVGDHRAAAVLHGALSRWGATTALPFEPSDAEHLDAAVEEVRSALGALAFAAAVEVGADLSETALVAYVQERITAQGA